MNLSDARRSNRLKQVNKPKYAWVMRKHNRYFAWISLLLSLSFIYEAMILMINYEEWEKKESETYRELVDVIIDKFERRQEFNIFDLVPELGIENGHQAKRNTFLINTCNKVLEEVLSSLV